MIQNRDIVYTCIQPWINDIATNGKNNTEILARHNRVLFVNPPIDRNSFFKEKNNPLFKIPFEVIQDKRESLMQVDENIWILYPKTVIESANWIPFTSVFRIINKLNNRRFAKDIHQGIKQLGFKNYIHFNDSDPFRSFHIKEFLKPVQSIYYTRDNLMGVPYWYKHGRLLEPELFAKSDLIVANSTYLAEIARKYNAHTYYIGQGCDVGDFDNNIIREVPDDIAPIASPIIGYIGSLLALRLDVELLEKIATSKKEWNFVFIGPEDAAFKNSLLHRLSNVYFLGLKELKHLPNYLSRFDVALNPQKINEVTIGNYPRKIDEYLAMGKPVVATPTGAMSIFKDYVYFASTPEEYIQQIEKALLENNTEKEKERANFAGTHTWENSVLEIYKAILKVNPELGEN